MGRPPLVERDAALDRVMLQFWVTGYDGTSLADLLRVSGMHRGSFYRVFGLKRQAFDAALRRYLERVATTDLAPALTATGPARERLKALMLDRLDDALGLRSGEETETAANRPGCMVVNTALELAPHDDAAQRLVAIAQEAMRAAFVSLVAESIAMDEVAGPVDAAVVGDELFTLLQGTIVAARAGRDRASLRQLLTRALATRLPIPNAEMTR